MSDTHAQTVSYVRDTMLGQSTPPLKEKGVFKWLRENLFSSWLNAILTVLSLLVIYLALSVVMPWVLGGVWNAGSLAECRDVLAAYGKSGHDGACWAVVDARWHQFLFGFYPSDLYWRPVAFFVLFFVAVYPILFSDKAPRQMLWFTAIYPFLAIWLIWGGAFWVPLLLMAGFVVGYLGYRLTVGLIGTALALVAGIVVAFVWWSVLTPAVDDGLNRFIATPKLAQAIETMPAEIQTVRAEQAEIEALTDELQEQIDAGLATLAEQQDVAITARADDTAALAPALDAYEQTRAELAVLRDEHKALSTVQAELRNEATALNRLSNRVTNLEDLEANLPQWREEALSLRAALPSSVAELRISENLPPEVTSDEADLLDAALEAENRVTNTEIAIDETYRELGRIGLRPVSSTDIGGFLLAIVLGLSGIGLSLPLGILLALGRQSPMLIINVSCVTFIEVIRGVPLIVWLFTASLLLNYFLPPGTSFDIVLRVIIMVTLFASAYIAEVIRGGLAALPKGQYEGADSLGLNYWQSMRLIVLPQALKISIPGIVNTFIGLFKDTTLVVFVGLFDPLKQMADSIRAETAWSGIYWEVFIFPGLIFFALCYGMGQYSLYLERKLQREHR